jgi:DNA-binding NtrC family response regulator
LVRHFIDLHAEPQSKIGFSKELVCALQNSNWPGNIRQLENLVRTILVTSKSRIKDLKDLPDDYKKTVKPASWQKALNQNDLKAAISSMSAEFEQEFIKYHLTKNSFNISQTAKSIGLSRVSLHKKIKQYNISLKV